MVKIAVCDDESYVREKLTSIVKKYFENIQRVAWVADFKNGMSLLDSNIRFDIIFLDIEMPDMDGIETAQKLRKWDVNSKIIYVTNHEKYQNRAYKVHAFDYISKPVDEKSIRGVLDEAVRYLDNSLKRRKCAFRTESGVITLELDDIFYFEYLSRKVIIHSSKGEFIANYSLKELYEKFSKYNFESPHKSFIVNMLYIKHIKGFDIFMENGVVIPLAQKKAVVFKERFNDFLQSTFDRI